MIVPSRPKPNAAWALTALSVALAPGVAHADVAWPALFLEPRLLSVPVVVLGLLIEALALRLWFDMSWARAARAAIVVNAVSAALGVILIPLAGIAWEIFPGLVLYEALHMGTFNPLTWAATFVLALAVTTALEVACLRMLFKAPWSLRRWGIWLAVNAVTVALAFASFAIQPPNTQHLYRAWLVAAAL